MRERRESNERERRISNERERRKSNEREREAILKSTTGRGGKMTLMTGR